MAYIIGLLNETEQAELERRGWSVEDAPEDFDETLLNLKMVWVDNDMFQIMDGPDWEKGEK